MRFHSGAKMLAVFVVSFIGWFRPCCRGQPLGSIIPSPEPPSASADAANQTMGAPLEPHRPPPGEPRIRPTIAGREPPSSRQRQPRSVQGVGRSPMGSDDRAAEPLAAQLRPWHARTAGARGHGGRPAPDAGPVPRAPPASPLPGALPLAGSRARSRRRFPGGGALLAARRTVGPAPADAREFPSACSVTRTSTGALPPPIRRLRSSGARASRLRGRPLGDGGRARTPLGRARRGGPRAARRAVLE